MKDWHVLLLNIGAAMDYIMYLMFLIFGILIGSFLNVCILRIPDRTFFNKSRSFCPKCGTQLRWYDLIPILSFIILKGKCRECKKKISLQYPLIEALNGALYVWIAVMYVNNPNLDFATAIIYCLLTSALIVISVVDVRTFIILPQMDIFILILGIVNLALNRSEWVTYVIGFFAVSGFMFILVLLNAMGDGDMKLMAVSGLILGWKLIILSFLLACVVGTIVHLTLMFTKKKGRQLPFGPYLSVGIFIAMLYGMNIIDWYFGLIFK